MALSAIHPGEHLAEELEVLDMSAASESIHDAARKNRAPCLSRGTGGIGAAKGIVNRFKDCAGLKQSSHRSFAKSSSDNIVRPVEGRHHPHDCSRVGTR